MNSHQRRKLRRKLFKNGPTLVKDWKELAEIPPSDTHYLEISVEDGNGYIKKKNSEEFLCDYLSTHTFYGSNYLRSTRRLQAAGFNVVLENWD